MTQSYIIWPNLTKLPHTKYLRIKSAPSPRSLMASSRRGDAENGAAALALCPLSAKSGQTEVSHGRASTEIRPSLSAGSIFPERGFNSARHLFGCSAGTAAFAQKQTERKEALWENLPKKRRRQKHASINCRNSNAMLDKAKANKKCLQYYNCLRFIHGKIW